MPSQTRYFQADVLRSAQRRGDLHGLYWFVEAEYPRGMVKPGIRRRQPAMWPHGLIPVLPAGPDVEVQQEWAEMLQGLFEAGNVGKGIAFKATLTTSDLLDGLRWYEYGSAIKYDVDHVCPKCGQITTAPAGTSPRCECYEW